MYCTNVWCVLNIKKERTHIKMSIEDDAVASKLRVFKTREKKTTHVLFGEFKWNGLQTVCKKCTRRKEYTQYMHKLLLFYFFALIIAVQFFRLLFYCFVFALILIYKSRHIFLYTRHIFVDRHLIPFPMSYLRST